MKKTLFIALAVAASFTLHAQNVDFGLKGGLNLATLSSSDNSLNSLYQNRTGFHVGALAQVNLSPQFAIQPEVVYSSQGTKFPNGSYQENLALNYVNIPVMVQAKIGSGVYAEAGPQLGILTSVTDKINGTETNYLSKQDFKSTDIALGFGLGYQGTSGIGIDARYNLGLTDINNSGRSNSIKNNVLQIGLFLKLNGARSRR